MRDRGSPGFLEVGRRCTVHRPLVLGLEDEMLRFERVRRRGAGNEGLMDRCHAVELGVCRQAEVGGRRARVGRGVRRGEVAGGGRRGRGAVLQRGLRLRAGHRLVVRRIWAREYHGVLELVVEFLVLACVHWLQLQLGTGDDEHKCVATAGLYHGGEARAPPPLVHLSAEGLVLGMQGTELLGGKHAVSPRAVDVGDGGFCDGYPGRAAHSREVREQRGQFLATI